MVSLIDRDALIAEYDRLHIGKPGQARQLMVKAPEVDAVPVRHGKWIKHEWAEESEGLLIPNYECSECHTWERKESDYCPKCGARMDGESDE